MKTGNIIPFGGGKGRGVLSLFRDPFTSLRKDVDALFDNTFTNFPNWMISHTDLTMDIIDSADKVTVKADLPGVSEDEISLRFVDNNLLIQCEKKEEKKEEGDNYYVMERGRGVLTRSISFPFQVDLDSVQAELDKGVLTIKIPKPKEIQGKSKDIPITRK